MDSYLKAPQTLNQAETRYQLFSETQDNIFYDLFLKIQKGATYEGRVTISFDLQKVSSELFVDYAGTTVNEIIINNQKIATEDSYESLRKKRFLSLPESSLQQGKNIVLIRFTNLYTNDGLGLHSFVDTDEKQYVYSQCAAYAANKMFPCFDQPDLKAKLNLVLAVPNEWVSISNQPVSDELTKGLSIKDYLSTEENSIYNLRAFSTTPKLSTYLYVVIAGPYLEVKCTNLYRDIQMSCFCRESLFQYVKEQAEQIFDITRESLKFYEKFFDYPYPFEKYDSIFCPEFKFGAMEHPGAVTFNDRYVWREKVTIDRSTQRANTIAHECSHHWFGNLVTMKWWNDLWLNESFAEFISHFCLHKIQNNLTTIKLSDPWLAFFNRKGSGYREDQQRSTHPIAGDIFNTDQADTIFDGITYSKGAATLKQLMHLIGEEGFGKAMAAYFKKFEWSNTTLNDFIQNMQIYYKPTYQGAPTDLNHWKVEWLQKAGLNECNPLFPAEDSSEQAKLVIQQSAALEAFPTLRHHKMQVAFFDDKGQVYQGQDIILDNKDQTEITYNGSKHPRALLLNYRDEAFIKVRLDGVSIAFFKENLALISDELTRTLIWRSLFDMVRDGQLSAYKFSEIVVQSLPKEPSDSILNNILTYVNSSFEFSPSVLNRNVLKPKLFECTLKVLLSTEKSNSNRIVLLVENLIGFASFADKRNIDNVAKIIDWFDGKDNDLKDFELDVTNKWSIISLIYRYSKLSKQQKSEYFNKVAEIDKSDRMKLAEKRCEAMVAEGEERKALFESYINPETKLSVQVISQSMVGYNSSSLTSQADTEAFFNNVLQIFKTRNTEFSLKFYSALFPHKEDFTQYVSKINRLIEEASGIEPLLKALQNSLDNIERKKKGILCSAPDLFKEFFNIHI